MSRYDNIPISEQTRKGMTLTIDDLSVIKRMFDLQDLIFEETLEKMNKSFNRRFGEQLKSLRNHCTRIEELEKKCA